MLPRPDSGSLTSDKMKRKWEGSGERDKELEIIFIKLISSLKYISANPKLRNHSKKKKFPLYAWHLAAVVMYNNLFTENYRNKEYKVWNLRALNSES